jgi:alkylation response protein AidB-like acyl-CoA dehydrogenase
MNTLETDHLDDGDVWEPIVASTPIDFDANPWNELDGDQRDLVELARRLADDELRPWAARWDEREEFPQRSYDVLRASGLLGTCVPAEFGGGGRSVFEGCLIVEQLARACVSSAMVAQAFLNGPWRAIHVLGTPEQHARYLPGVAAGTRHFAIAMSEPGAGSAGTDLRAELRPDGDAFTLHGTKCWITGGREADTIVVFCRAPGSSGPRGIGAVLVNRGAPGTGTPIVDPKMGFRGVAEATIVFDGVRIAPEDVLVAPDPESKRGAQILVNQFNPERCGNAAMCTGVAQAALDDSVNHVKARQQFGRTLSGFQGIQWTLADMALDVEVARMLVWRATRSVTSGFPEQRSTILAKLHASEMVQRVTNNALQLHGARGYSRRWPVERYFRDSRGLTLGGGTAQIMRNLLGGIVLGERHSQRAPG